MYLMDQQRHHLPTSRFLMSMLKHLFLAAIGLVWISSAATLAEETSSTQPQFTEAQLDFFEKKVRPILVTRCYECHGPESEPAEGNLVLGSHSELLQGGDSGPAVEPGKVDESLLIDSIRYDGLYQMPPKSRMPDDEIAILETWVKQGAAWPSEDENRSRNRKVFDLAQRKQSHWSWQPVTRPEVPTVQSENWPKDAIDNFVLAKLEASDLNANPTADKATILRRVYFDLIGLPPSPVEVQDFIADNDPNAYSNLVDRLLDSPRFGEHWARRWLDLVRFAESRGHEFDYQIPNAHEYRDYLIRALNQDVPYDQIVQEHVAGDLLPNPRMNEDGFNESVLGTGFWHLGDWVHSPVDIRKDESDRFDNMIEVMNKTFLSLTVSCARCHDHKFDAISQKDYYAQMGFLQSSGYCQVRFETKHHNRKVSDQLHQLDQQTQDTLHKLLATHADQRSSTWEKDLTTAIGDSEGLSDPAQKWREMLQAAAGDSKHPLHFWAKYLLAEDDDARDAVVQQMSAVLSKLSSESEQPSQNVIHDFRTLATSDWRSDGFVFGKQPRVAGTYGLSADGLTVAYRSALKFDPRWSGLKLSPGTHDDPGKISGWNRAGRTWKSKTFKLTDGRVHYLVRGAGRALAVIDSHRMINGPLHGRAINQWDHTKDNKLHWVTQDLRDYRGHEVHIEWTPLKDKPFELLTVCEGPQHGVFPTEEQLAAAAFSSGLEGPAVAPIPSFIQAMQKAFTLPVESTSDLESESNAFVANLLVSHADLLMPEIKPHFDKTLQQYQSKSAKLTRRIEKLSRTAPGMWDNSAEQEYLMIRGNSKNLGEKVNRGLLTALADEPAKYDPQGSGRFELARQIVSRQNPYASRVIVNRLWHHLLGRGIVPSVDNFGVLGQEPPHPELLDYLATEFVEDGWSLKQLIRRIVHTQTYQMSSNSGRPEDITDPNNILLHRANVKRLSGEMIRDSLLSVSGKLDPKMYGRSVPVHLTSFMQGRGRPGKSGPLDGDNRRSVYLEVRRNFLSPWMLAFDTPQPVTTTGKRNQSNVPAQSLILLNDPLVHQLCTAWTKRVIDQVPQDTDHRVEVIYLEAFGRQPDANELNIARSFLESHSKQLGIRPDEIASSEPLWRDFIHVIVNTKPFIFIP